MTNLNKTPAMKWARIVWAVLLSSVACQPDVDPIAPTTGTRATGHIAHATGKGAGTTVSVSPRAAMVYSRVDAAPRDLEFSARLLDSLGEPLAPPSPGIEWALAERGVLRLVRTDVSGDGLTARATVRAGQAGRDSLFAQSGHLFGSAAVTNWEWTTASLSGPNWTTVGQSGCLEYSGQDGEGNTVRLADFEFVDHLTLDPQVATVDSLVASTENDTARLCMTGQRTVSGLNHGKKSRKFIQDRTICHPCRLGRIRSGRTETVGRPSRLAGIQPIVPDSCQQQPASGGHGFPTGHPTRGVPRDVYLAAKRRRHRLICVN